jgi:hypothetical protein
MREQVRPVYRDVVGDSTVAVLWAFGNIEHAEKECRPQSEVPIAATLSGPQCAGEQRNRAAENPTRAVSLSSRHRVNLPAHIGRSGKMAARRQSAAPVQEIGDIVSLVYMRFR